MGILNSETDRLRKRISDLEFENNRLHKNLNSRDDYLVNHDHWPDFLEWLKTNEPDDE